MTLEVLRATFWSEDYVSGIKVLFDNIESDTNELRKWITIIKGFHEKALTPTLKSLTKQIEEASSQDDGDTLSSKLQRQQVNMLENILAKLRLVNQDALEVQCQSSLEALLFEYEEYRQDSKDLIDQNYRSYCKHLGLAKDAEREVEIRARRIREAIAKPLPRGEDSTTTPSSETDKDEEEQRCDMTQFPIVLDKKLTFNNNDEFLQFCNRLKKVTKTSQRLIRIPGVANEYFSSSALFEALKRLEPRMDVSLFNLERVGQLLLDLQVIWPYNGVLGSNVLFTAQGYYIWCEHSGNTSEHADPKHTKTADVFNGFFKRISGAKQGPSEIVSVEELEQRQQELQKFEEQYFQECQNLDYWRTELELEMQKCMCQYDKMLQHKVRVLNGAATNFGGLLQQAFSVESPVTAEDPSAELDRVYNANYGTVGFYTPQPGVTFVKHNLEKGNLLQPAIFHTDLQKMPATEDGVTVVLQVFLKFLYEHEPGEVLRAWSAPMTLKRISRLRRECLYEFRDAKGDHESTLTNTLRGKPRPLTDVVGLLQSWLLELPDSLIPMPCYERVFQGQGIAGLRRAPQVHLTNLAAMCDHFHWLASHCESDHINHAFGDRTDLPLCHVFARTREQKPQDASAACEIVKTILCNDLSAEQLRTMAENVRPRSVTSAENTADPIARASSPSSASQHLTPPAVFVPRPFKTATGTPETPDSRPNSKRISGLDLAVLGQQEEPAATDQTLAPDLPLT